FGPSINPDLRKIPPELHAQFKNIVLKGALGLAGVESFSDILSEADVDAIHAYVIDQAWQGYNEPEQSQPQCSAQRGLPRLLFALLARNENVFGISGFEPL